jgi:DNA-binding CsgD family transcriptional regulator
MRPLRRTLVHPEYPQLEAQITLLRPHALRLSHPSFLIRITDANPGAGMNLDSPSPAAAPVNAQLLARLSPAERELVPHLRQGLSNKEIARVLGKGVPTVKKQIHSVFEKLGSPSRARLMALLK